MVNTIGCKKRFAETASYNINRYKIKLLVVVESVEINQKEGLFNSFIVMAKGNNFWLIKNLPIGTKQKKF